MDRRAFLFGLAATPIIAQAPAPKIVAVNVPPSPLMGGKRADRIIIDDPWGDWPPNHPNCRCVVKLFEAPLKARLLGSAA